MGYDPDCTCGSCRDRRTDSVFSTATAHLNQPFTAHACNCWGSADRGCAGCPMRRPKASEYQPRHAKPKAAGYTYLPQLEPNIRPEVLAALLDNV